MPKFDKKLRQKCAAPATVYKCGFILSCSIKLQAICNTTVLCAWEGEMVMLVSPDTGQNK